MKWAWKDYRVARIFKNKDRMVEEAIRIRTIQEGIGVKVSVFEELDLTWPNGFDRELETEVAMNDKMWNKPEGGGLARSARIQS